MSEVTPGTRNYEVEYVQYVRDKTIIIKLKDGTQMVASIISIINTELHDGDWWFDTTHKVFKWHVNME